MTNAPAATPPSRRMLALGALWGIAEATVFIVVPDVLLTAVALRQGLNAGLLVALATALAAAAGGLAVALAVGAGLITPAVFDPLPAISPAMIANAGEAMQRADWPWALVAGSFSGVPYKLYAAGAGVAGTSLVLFALVSLPGRLLRFALVVGAVALVRGPAARRLGQRGAMLALAGFWVVFYALFWALKAG